MHATEARRKGIKVKTFTIMMREVPRAIADGEEVGVVKLHVREGFWKKRFPWRPIRGRASLMS
jgi:pyruvate/2-oxoglutarate dehydrogenase complex dihydrolipoamide dehydrogenase (E3) component